MFVEKSCKGESQGHTPDKVVGILEGGGLWIFLYLGHPNGANPPWELIGVVGVVVLLRVRSSSALNIEAHEEGDEEESKEEHKNNHHGFAVYRKTLVAGEEKPILVRSHGWCHGS